MGHALREFDIYTADHPDVGGRLSNCVARKKLGHEKFNRMMRCYWDEMNQRYGCVAIEREVKQR